MYLTRISTSLAWAFRAAEHLVNHDVRVGQRVAFALGAAGEQHRAHAGRLADAIGVHVAGHELHRVVNRQPATLPPGELM